MDIRYIRNPWLRRAAAVAMLPFGAIACLIIALGIALKEYGLMLRGTPEEFMRVWRGMP